MPARSGWTFDRAGRGRTIMKHSALIALSIFLAGCAIQTAEVKSPTFDEQLQPPKPTYTNGSIWQASSGGLAEDMKARRPGDILTVVIVEQASASKEATTDTERNSSMAAGIPYLLGLETSNQAGVPLGRIAEILELPAHPVLVLKGDRERLVPLVPERLVAVDLEAGHVTLDWHPDD